MGNADTAERQLQQRCNYLTVGFLEFLVTCSNAPLSSHLRNQPPNHAAVQQTGLQPLAATNKQRAKCIRFVAAHPVNAREDLRQIQRIVEPADHLSTSTG